MKIQKILGGLVKGTTPYLTKQFILSRLSDLKKVENEIKMNEKQLAEELKTILQNDAKLKELDPFFNLIVSANEDDPGYEDTLLNTACLLVAQSLNRLHGVSDEKENVRVNYAGEFFTVRASEISEKLQIVPSNAFDGLFKRFNELMEPYEVWIKQLNLVALEFSPMRIHIRILK